jgi:ornithine carbamoyltransferase
MGEGSTIGARMARGAVIVRNRVIADGVARMKAKHLISLADLAPVEIQEILDVAAGLKAEVKAGHQRPLLAGKVLALLFQKPSLRTRVSFDVGMGQLGGRAIYLSPDEVGLGARESVPDVARVLSRFVDIVVARTFAHHDVVDLATYGSVPVVNGLSDFSHPCQALADFLTIREKLGRLAGVNLAYVGDGNNVANSLLFGGSKLGVNLAIASPAGYEPMPEVVGQAREAARASGSQVVITHEPAEAVRGADVVYTDVWTSMGQEAEAEQRRRAFHGYQVDGRLLSMASPDAIVLHDLPAHRGEEITDEVMDGPQSAVFDQAENRLHAQKAVVALLLGARPFREI